MTILPPPRRAQTTGERYVAELALGRDPREGIHVYTDGPVPETGTVNIFTVEYRFGRARPALIEPFPADHLARWRGYSLDMQTFPPIDRERPRKPTWDVFEDDGTPLYTLEIFRTRVRAHDDRLFAELLTLPGDRPRPGIFGWQATIPPGDEIQRAVHGLELLGLELEFVQELDAARHAGGMPSYYDDANEHLFFERLVDGIHDVVRDGDRMSLSSLKVRMSLDRRTVKKYVGEFEYDLTALEAEAIRCTNRLSPCTVHVRRRSEFKKKRP